MDPLATEAFEMTIHDIRMCLDELEKQGELSITVANQIKAFKFELNYARLSLLGDYPSLHEPVRSWVNLAETDLLQPIRIGRMPVDLLEETMSRLLQMVDDCPTIDNIYKCLEKLENRGDLPVSVENHIQNLKFELRNLRIHFKWRTFYTFPVSCEVRARVKDVEKGLLQPIRKGSMNLDLLEEKLSSLLPSMKLKKNVEYSALWFHAEHGWDPAGFTPNTLDFAYPDALNDELVLEWIHPLIENVKHLIRWKDNLVDFPKEQFEALVEKLSFLRNFLEITGTELEKVIKNVTPMQGLVHKTSEDLLIRIKWLIQNAIYVSLLSWAEGENRWIRYFLVLLAKLNHIEPEIRRTYVQFLKASQTASKITLGNDLLALAAVDSLLDNLQKLLKDRSIGSIMHYDVHQIEILHQELSFLKYFLMDPHGKQQSETEAQSFNSLLIRIEAIVRELGASLNHFMCVGQMEDHMAAEMNLLCSDLRKILDLLKTNIRQTYWRVPKPSTSTSPWTSKLGFLNFFMQNLEELLQHKADSIAYVKNDIETLQSEFAQLSPFIKETIKNFETDDSNARAIMDVAYEAERLIDLILASHFPRWYYMLWLSEIIENLKTLRKDCIKLCSKKTCDISWRNTVEQVPMTDFLHSSTPAHEEELVGFQDEADKIIDRLTAGSEELQIVSIVGMPGLGKTTLARKVYDHPLVCFYFHVRSWYCISQVYDRRDLLLSIASNITEKIHTMEDEDMAELIYRSLKGRRYLIVLDDIWSIEPWNDTRKLFPDDGNGSRILFTSRIREIALQANPTRAPHDLRLFSDEESWELLKKKVFHQRNCPAELYKIGKQIAENCKGLPLSVVLIAGVLKKMESEDHWKQVSESLGKQVVLDLSKFILELSYKHLPDHLKPCFLYFGVFPEDNEIPAWKLIRLWIAEGFIQRTKSHSMENVAEGYLMDLIARSLVSISQSKSKGGVKSCSVHDLLHEFSKGKAKDKNFLLISKEIHYDPEQYQQCCYYGDKSLCGWMPCDPYVRSVVFYPIRNRYVWDKTFVPSVVFHSLKLLRVLDLQHITLVSRDFQAVTELLLHLRYFACSIQGKLNHVPSSVRNLWRLETLLVKTMYGMEVSLKLPETLLEMPFLKHVSVSDEAAFEFPSTFELEKSSESGIEKFSTLLLYLDDSTTEKVIRRLKGIRKLKCILLKSSDQNMDSNIQFPALDLLSELESLKATYRSSISLSEFSFPSNLKKLTLSWFGLPWSEISKIGNLPQLKVLKLLHGAFKGTRWDVNDDEFRNLKFLKLEWLDIMEWTATADAFPSLEQLVLKRCKELKEVPMTFGESSTLQMIEVKGCRNSVNKAVFKIQEEQHDLGAAGFKVLIGRQDSSPSNCAYLPSESVFY